MRFSLAIRTSLVLIPENSDLEKRAVKVAYKIEIVEICYVFESCNVKLDLCEIIDFKFFFFLIKQNGPGTAYS